MVTRIGHVGLIVTDLQRSLAHAERVMGLRVSERIGDTAYLTCNARHHELVLTEGDAVGCDHLAFDVATSADLDRVQARLAAERIEIVAEQPLEAGVAGAVRFVAPGGFVIEVLHGMRCDQPADYDTVGARPRKFEHITVKSSEKDELERVLETVLGLRLSDRAEDAISWWRASAEHHGISVIRADVDALQHYAWQVEDWSFIARTGDHLARHDKAFLWGPGHHGIGDNYFCYFPDDDGVLVEYSAGILRVEDEAAYEPKVWPNSPLSVNRWGNPSPPDEFVAAGIPLRAPASTVAQVAR